MKNLFSPRRFLFLYLFFGVAGFSPVIASQDDQPVGQLDTQVTRRTLESLAAIRGDLKKKIDVIDKKIEAVSSQVEKQELRAEEAQLKEDFQTASRNFDEVAAGYDISVLRSSGAEQFDLKKEVLQLLEPTLKELKGMTSGVRKKSDLKEKIDRGEQKVSIAKKAVTNIQLQLKRNYGPAVDKQLREDLGEWQQELIRIESDQQSAKLQLNKLVAEEIPFAQASQNYLRQFFQRRGRYLGGALIVLLSILLLSRFSGLAMRRFIPGFRKQHRSFRIRLVHLLHRLLTVFFAIIGPMVVFYVVEDWLLFSIGILLLFGIGWTIRGMVPRYWRQMQTFLNVGAVREGERVYLDGLPWMVKDINVFSTLENPKIKLNQRIPISELVDMKSRPLEGNEPWFPCAKGDWVILADGVRGKVTGVSPEMVELVERGGSHKSYLMADFLAQAPRNLATNFRIKETIGITYNLQKESTSTIPKLLEEHVRRRIEEEGYGQQLVNLRVEFEQAGSSSLNIVVITDFKGELGDLYNRLRRSIQRWCVDACSENGWEIPFTQITLHGPSDLTLKDDTAG